MLLQRIDDFMTRRRILLVAAMYTALAHAGIVIAIKGLLP